MARPWSNGFNVGFGPPGVLASANADSMQLIAYVGGIPLAKATKLYYDFSNSEQFYLVSPGSSYQVDTADAKQFYANNNQSPKLTFFGYVPS